MRLFEDGDNPPIYQYPTRREMLPQNNQWMVKMLHPLKRVLKRLYNYPKAHKSILFPFLGPRSILATKEL